MSSTKAAAEQAAIKSLGRQWDSQDCREFQGEVLSSNAREPPEDDATVEKPSLPTTHTETAVVDDGRNEKVEGEELQEEEVEDQVLLAQWASVHGDNHSIKGDDDNSRSEQAVHTHLYQSPPPINTHGSAPENNAEDHNKAGGGPGPLIEDGPDQLTNRRILRRDLRGRLRLFSGGEERAAISQQSLRLKKGAMDDLELSSTQKSSMSLTQENSESAYERFRARPVLVNALEEQSRHTTQMQSKSLNAESTTHTYGEDDTGHVDLDFQLDLHTIEKVPEESTQEQGTVEQMHERSSQIKAMSQDEATQDGASQGLVSQDPLYARHHIVDSNQPHTPAPPVNPFTHKGSVMKGHELFGATQPSSIARVMQSPTSSRPSPDVFNQFATPKLPSSPLQTRDVYNSALQQGQSSPVSSSRRTSSPQRGGPASSFQPRAYRSMKESQERRRMAKNNNLNSDSDSDSSVSSIEATVKKRNVDETIKRELSAVGLRRTKQRSSGHPPSSATPDPPRVEVPSTSTRRRSTDDDYLAQCSGFDARDTQQDDIIADSQHLPSQRLRPSDHSHPQPNSLEDATVPETSPYPDREQIRPMRDIASFSYSAEEENLNMEDIAGFTQDDDFDRAIGKPPAPQHSRESFDRLETSHTGTPAAPEDHVTVDVDPDATQDIDISHTVKQSELEDRTTIGVDPGATPNFKISDVVERTELERQSIVDAASGGTQNVLETVSHDLFRSVHETPPITPTSCVAEQILSEENDKDTAIRQTAANDSISTSAVQASLQAPINAGALSTELVPAIAKSPSAYLASSALSSVLSSLHGFDSDNESKCSDHSQGNLASASTKDSEKSSNTAPRPKNPPGNRVKRTTNRKATRDPEAPTRMSKRKSVQSLRESSDDPLALTSEATARPIAKMKSKKPPTGLFDRMAFAVSYASSSNGEKEKVTKWILENGGRILEQGFDALFESPLFTGSDSFAENIPSTLHLLPAAQDIGFTALIADSHSRKAKYMQALALGLPCLSGVWITSCVVKKTIVDWSPYLLCAGQSAILSAFRSRILKPYSAADAQLVNTLEARDKLLEGKSILLITGKGKQVETRQAYLFIARVLGPSRVSQAIDLPAARKKLAESERDGVDWDLVYVDKDEETASSQLFSSKPLSASTRKRKTRASETPEVAPKRVRVISDEVVVQSLIFGQLLDE